MDILMTIAPRFKKGQGCQFKNKDVRGNGWEMANIYVLFFPRVQYMLWVTSQVSHYQMTLNCHTDVRVWSVYR